MFKLTLKWVSLVEHFKFFSEKNGEKLRTFSAVFGLFQNFHLENGKVVKMF
jgi:hypothetical protein